MYGIFRPEVFIDLAVMPKKVVVQNSCDRCARVWFTEYDKADEDPPAVTINITQASEVTTVAYGALCPSCFKAIKNYLTSIAKQLKGKSPERKSVAK